MTLRHFRYQGSDSDLSVFTDQVCFALKSGRRGMRSAFPFCATTGLMQRSKWHFYSISSSARPLSASGTAMPSALAVLRLIISSTLVDLWTGRSPGFAPLRIFPV